MSRYKILTSAKGAKYMSHIQNLIFKPIIEGEFFVEPWENRELADCAEFRLRRPNGFPAGILFFISDQKLADFLLDTLGQLYLFGAYNQVTVCQMRSKGTVTFENSPLEIGATRERLRAKITKRIGAQVNQLSAEEACVRFKILDRGRLFCFYPEEYAYAIYERG